MTLPMCVSHSGDGTFNLEHYNADQLKKKRRGSGLASRRRAT